MIRHGREKSLNYEPKNRMESYQIRRLQSGCWIWYSLIIQLLLPNFNERKLTNLDAAVNSNFRSWNLSESFEIKWATYLSNSRKSLFLSCSVFLEKTFHMFTKSMETGYQNKLIKRALFWKFFSVKIGLILRIIDLNSQY